MDRAYLSLSGSYGYNAYFDKDPTMNIPERPEGEEDEKEEEEEEEETKETSEAREARRSLDGVKAEEEEEDEPTPGRYDIIKVNYFEIPKKRYTSLPRSMLCNMVGGGVQPKRRDSYRAANSSTRNGDQLYDYHSRFPPPPPPPKENEEPEEPEFFLEGGGGNVDDDDEDMEQVEEDDQWFYRQPKIGFLENQLQSTQSKDKNQVVREQVDGIMVYGLSRKEAEKIINRYGPFDFDFSYREVELVMEQADATLQQAIQALKNNNGDIINAIMDLYS